LEQQPQALDRLGAINAIAWHGDPAGAIPLYNQAIAQNPANAQAYAFRGLAYRRLGNYQQAMADLNHAIELDPAFAMGHVIRGSTHRGLGDL